MARKLPNRLLPSEAHYAGEAHAAGAEVRFYCPRCRQVFRVSLPLMVRVKGPRYVLLDKRPLCRVAACGGRGFYLYAASMQSPMVPILAEPTPQWLMGPCPADFRPAEDGGPDSSGPGPGSTPESDDRPRWIRARVPLRPVD